MILNDKSLYIDVQDIRNYIKDENILSGIQRVIFELIRNCKRYFPGDVFLSYYDEGVYFAVPFALDKESKLIDVCDLRRLLWVNKYFESKYKLEKYRNKKIRYCFHMLKGFIRGRQKYKSREFIADYKFTKYFKPFEVINSVKKDDIIIIMGAHVGNDDMSHIFSKAASKGVLIYQFIHDLIPYYKQNLYDQDHVDNFIKWLNGTLNYSRSYICNSNKTASDLKLFCNVNQSSKRIYISELARQKVVEGGGARKGGAFEELRADIRSLINYNYVLCVGTREVRKNNWRLLQAWSLLLKNNSQMDLPKLVFAGKRGWMNEDFEDFLSSSGNLYGWVRIIDSPTDVELDALYKHCLFTVYVSLCEGWGLPIGEALSYGKCGVYSNQSPMPEVGLNSGIYCDPYSINSIYESIVEVLENKELRGRLSENASMVPERNWNDVAASIMENIVLDNQK